MGVMGPISGVLAPDTAGPTSKKLSHVSTQFGRGGSAFDQHSDARLCSLRHADHSNDAGPRPVAPDVFTGLFPRHGSPARQSGAGREAVGAGVRGMRRGVRGSEVAPPVLLCRLPGAVSAFDGTRSRGYPQRSCAHRFPMRCPMAALLDFEKCSSCGGYHDFFLAGPLGFSQSGRYEFVCPTTNQSAVLRPSKAHNIVSARPSNAVEVSPMEGRD